MDDLKIFLGATVADAASRPLHWVYDPKKLNQYIKGKKFIECLLPRKLPEKNITDIILSKFFFDSACAQIFLTKNETDIETLHAESINHIKKMNKNPIIERFFGKLSWMNQKAIYALTAWLVV